VLLFVAAAMTVVALSLKRRAAPGRQAVRATVGRHEGGGARKVHLRSIRLIGPGKWEVRWREGGKTEIRVTDSLEKLLREIHFAPESRRGKNH